MSERFAEIDIAGQVAAILLRYDSHFEVEGVEPDRDEEGRPKSYRLQPGHRLVALADDSPVEVGWAEDVGGDLMPAE